MKKTKIPHWRNSAKTFISSKFLENSPDLDTYSRQNLSPGQQVLLDLDTSYLYSDISFTRQHFLKPGLLFDYKLSSGYKSNIFSFWKIQNTEKKILNPLHAKRATTVFPEHFLASVSHHSLLLRVLCHEDLVLNGSHISTFHSHNSPQRISLIFIPLL